MQQDAGCPSINHLSEEQSTAVVLYRPCKCVAAAKKQPLSDRAKGKWKVNGEAPKRLQDHTFTGIDSNVVHLFVDIVEIFDLH